MHTPHATYQPRNPAPPVFIERNTTANITRRPLTTCLAERLFLAFAFGISITATLVFIANHL